MSVVAAQALGGSEPKLLDAARTTDDCFAQEADLSKSGEWSLADIRDLAENDWREPKMTDAAIASSSCIYSSQTMRTSEK